jgi:hypothetical protein
VTGRADERSAGRPHDKGPAPDPLGHQNADQRIGLEADDPWKRNEEFAASDREFDVWFRSELTRIFPPFVDFSVPIQGVEEIFDSETLPRPE